MKRLLIPLVVILLLLSAKQAKADILPMPVQPQEAFVDELIKEKPLTTYAVESPHQEAIQPVTWQDNPQGCDQNTQWIAAEEPFYCINKPIKVEIVQKPIAQKTVQATKPSGSLSFYTSKPYVYGAAGPNSFDCSGLTQYFSRQRGISIPRSSTAQIAALRHISASEARYGDVIAFNNHHVGLYLGNGMVLHALNPAQGIQVMTIAEAIRYNGFISYLAVGH